MSAKNKIRDTYAVFTDIPNTPEGREFIRLVKKHLTRPHLRVSVRGRSKNRRAKGAHRSHVKATHADTFSIYMERRYKKVAVTYPCPNCNGEPSQVKYEQTGFAAASWKVTRECLECAKSGSITKWEWKPTTLERV